MRLLKVHVLYECGGDGRPHGCGEIRLIRPLSYPSIKDEIQLTYGTDVPQSNVDIVVVERLWDNHRRNPALLMSELCALKKKGVKIIYEIDDDLLSVNSDIGVRLFPSTTQRMWIREVARLADGIIVSTPNLASRFKSLNKNIVIVQNALDDTLFNDAVRLNMIASSKKPIVFGYMGTPTHFEDLLLILQPLRSILFEFRESVQLEIVGVGDSSMLKSLFPNLPVTLRQVPTSAVSYVKFVNWMQSNLRWDFGIAPLVNSTFTSSKSDIKYLDYGVQGIPSIFSNVPAYNNTIKHGVNGLLADNSVESWVQCLRMMINDKTLRSNLAAEAHSHILDSRLLKTQSNNWVDALRRLIAHPLV